MEESIREESKKKLLQVSKSVITYSEEALLKSIDYRRKKDKKNLPFDENLFNVLEFLLLLNFEINSLLNDMVSSESKLGPNLYGRHILLIVHESTLTLRNMLAKHFKGENKYKFGPIDIVDLKNIHSKICKLHDKSVKKFGDVRNGITAHKDEDPETRIKLIETSDVREVTNLVLDFFPLILRLQKPLYQYLEKTKEQSENNLNT